MFQQSFLKKTILFLLIIPIIFLGCGTKTPPIKYNKDYIGMDLKEFKAIHTNAEKPKEIITEDKIKLVLYKCPGTKGVKNSYYYFRKNKLAAIIHFFKKNSTYPSELKKLKKKFGKPDDIAKTQGVKMALWDHRKSTIKLYQTGTTPMTIKIYGNYGLDISSRQLILFFGLL